MDERSCRLDQLHVLVVDDSRAVRRLVRTMLAELGVRQVVEAADGGAALKALHENPVDLALVDNLMEPMDGIAFTRAVRNDRGSQHPHLPIIMMTGQTDRRSILAIRDSGANEILAKPMSPRSLVDRLTLCIERPRPFVRTKGYYGPCRRRMRLDGFAGRDRRVDPDADAPGVARINELIGQLAA